MGRGIFPAAVELPRRCRFGDSSWQAVVLVMAALAVLGLSAWRREPLGAYFLAALLLLVPLAMLMLGFVAAEGFFLYPFYSWTARLS